MQCAIDALAAATHLTDGVDVDVVLGLLGVGNERLDEESPQVSLNVLDLLDLVCARGNPLLRLLPGSVKLQEPRLASPLDELIGLRDELGTGGEEERIGGLGGIEDALDVVAVGEGDGSELRRRVVDSLCGERSGLDDGRASEVVVEDGLAVGLEDGLGGHCEVCGEKVSRRTGEENVSGCNGRAVRKAMCLARCTGRLRLSRGVCGVCVGGGEGAGGR